MANPQDFDGYALFPAGVRIFPADWTDLMEGLQAEYEERMETWARNGVWSGMDCTIDGTTIAIASGEAYCEGKRYAGSGSVEFSGEAAGTYYVYIDPTDDTTPFKAKTTVPTSGELCLCLVVWSGVALSGLVDDYKQYGLLCWKHARFCSGSINSTNYPTSSIVDFIIVDRDLWLENVQVAMRVVPTGSSVIIDVHAGHSAATPTTIWTTQAYRPTVLTTHTNNQVVAATGYITTNRALSAGDIITIYIDQVDSGNNGADLAISLYGRYM